jgi:hypothetical protein
MEFGGLVETIGPKQQDFDLQHFPRLGRNALGQSANAFPDFHIEIQPTLCMKFLYERCHGAAR